MRAPLTNDGGQHVGSVVAFRDVGDAIRMQEERTRASKLESLGLLAGGIAHDFNNILTAILGNVSLVRADARIDIQSDGALADAERACVRARQLTQQLLTFAKGGAPIKKPLRVERVIRESVHMALSGSTVSCAMKIDPALWAVNADEGQLIQVLNNILINAQQAMPRGGRVVIRAENVSEPVDRWEQGIKVAAGPYSSVSISDEGAGIGPSHLGRIYEP
ncbi:MAG: hybrid sensor histidine kinase/response regulator, partial [Acidobacteria bacterium]